MKTSLTALTSILLAFLFTGAAVGTANVIDQPQETVTTGGTGGQAVGCELIGDGNVFGYGQAGVPSSENGGCSDFSARFAGEVVYTVVKNPERNGYTSLWSNDGTGFAERFVNCGQPAALIVDWTTDPPTETYLQGEDCFIYLAGDISTESWASYGGGTAGVKFVHTDNLADALVHLLV